jgi:hypothetical protein
MAYFMMNGQIKLDTFFTLSGSVDTYFRANLNSTNDASNGGTLAPFTSFANLPGFSIGMFNINGKYEKGKAGFVADMVFGPRGKEAVFNSQGSLNTVNQAFAYIKLRKNTTITLGKFNTFVGYEAISPVLNFHYSTSYMFSYGPFNHTGIKLNYAADNGFSTMVGIFDPSDFTDFNPTGKYYLGGQVSYSFEKGSAAINLLTSTDYLKLDLTTIYKPLECIQLGLNATVEKNRFSGSAIYLQYKSSDDLTFGIRSEYFQDNGLNVLNISQPESKNNHVINTTVSSNITIGNLRIIPELRIDLFSQNVIVPDASKLEKSNRLSSFLLAAVYSF